MRVAWPRHTPHVHFVFFRPTIELLNWLYISACSLAILSTCSAFLLKLNCSLLSFCIACAIYPFFAWLLSVSTSNLSCLSLSCKHSILYIVGIDRRCVEEAFSYLAWINATGIQDYLPIFILFIYRWVLHNLISVLGYTYFYLLPRAVVCLSPAPQVLDDCLLLCSRHLWPCACMTRLSRHNALGYIPSVRTNRADLVRFRLVSSIHQYDMCRCVGLILKVTLRVTWGLFSSAGDKMGTNWCMMLFGSRMIPVVLCGLNL